MSTPAEQLVGQAITAEQTVAAPLMKVGTAWGAVGVATGTAEIARGAAEIAMWVDIAQLVATVLAAIYTLALLCEWVWKKTKWLRRRDRRHDDKK